MEATAYLKQRERMCREHICDEMCPIGKLGRCSDRGGYEDLYPEDAVMAVEKWAEENPERTNGEALLDCLEKWFGFQAEVYDKDESMDAVVLKIPKAWWNKR